MNKEMDKIISSLAILRTWAKVNPMYGKGLDIEECNDAVQWLDDAITFMKRWEPEPIKAKNRDKELLCVAGGIRMFIENCGGYDKVQLIIERSMAEYLADRIEEIFQDNRQ